MLVLTLLFSAFGIYFLGMRVRIDRYPLSASHSFRIALPYVLIFLYLLTTVILYWILRRFIFRRLWANLHVLFLYLGLVALPFLHRVVVQLLPRSPSMDEPLVAIRFYLFWTLAVLANIFFGALVIKSVQHRKTAAYMPADEQELFDGWIDEK